MKNDECLGLPLFSVAAGVRLLREITETECRERSSPVSRLVKTQMIEESFALFSATNKQSFADTQYQSLFC